MAESANLTESEREEIYDITLQKARPYIVERLDLNVRLISLLIQEDVINVSLKEDIENERVSRNGRVNILMDYLQMVGKRLPLFLNCLIQDGQKEIAQKLISCKSEARKAYEDKQADKDKILSQFD